MRATATTAHGDPECRRDGGDEPAADTRHHGGARRHLQRPARRLHRQRARRPSRARTPISAFHYAVRDYPAGRRPMPGRPAEQRLIACRPAARRINNNSIAGTAINPVTYQGIRVEALYKFNEDWNALLAQSYQNMHSQGVFYQQPNASDGAPLPPLEVTLFNTAYDKDKFENTALTVERQVRRSSRPSIPAATWSATSIRPATTPITPAASTPITISATAGIRR